MKKLLVAVLVLCMALSMLPAFALELLSGGDTYPIDTDKTIVWYAQSSLNPHEKFTDWKESPFHTGLSRETGVNIEWMFPTTGTSGGTFTNTLLADPTNLPHIMKGNFMDSAEQLLADGIIWDLTPYLEEYAPAYYAFLKAHPLYDKAMKTDDGKYYAFGFFREDGGWNDSYTGPVVRKDWLDECGLEIPKTISEFENVMFNEKYGAKFSFSWGAFSGVGLGGAFGTYGTSNLTYYIKDGKVRIAQMDEGWRNYVVWVKQLFDDGLFDQDNFSLDNTSIKAKIHNGKCGVSMTTMGQLSNWMKEATEAGSTEQWVAIPYPTDDEGNISAIFGGVGIGTSNTVVTKCADEETMKLCLQALDYAYTQEGFLYWNYGTKGVSWDYNENGEPTFTALVNDDPDTDAMSKYVGVSGGASCIQATRFLYLKNEQVAIDANNVWFYSVPVEVSSGWKWPIGATFTAEESDELALIATNLSTYSSESFANFVTGVKDINDDDVWESYLAAYEDQYQVERVLEIRQACYDRYLER